MFHHIHTQIGFEDDSTQYEIREEQIRQREQEDDAQEDENEEENQTTKKREEKTQKEAEADGEEMAMVILNKHLCKDEKKE